MVAPLRKDPLEGPIETRDGVAGIQKPAALLESLPEDLEPLLDLANRHVVSARQFARDQLLQLCRMAASYETRPMVLQKPLGGKILITAFYEPSTRTRLSFESAWHRLGGDVISITDPATTGIAKGESHRDVAEMFNNYGDVVVLRDSREESVHEMLKGLRIPIVNAGNGIDEHPTQALADLFAMLKWRPGLAANEVSASDRIRFGIIGNPGRMRTVRSLLLFLAKLKESIAEVVVINPDEHLFSPGQEEELRDAGLAIRVERRLKPVLPDLDLVYINSIAWVGDTYEKLTGDMKLSAQSPLKEGAIVLHPLARGEELDTSLDDTPHNWYFAQARGAVFVRMALLTCLVQRVGRVADVPVNSRLQQTPKKGESGRRHRELPESSRLGAE